MTDAELLRHYATRRDEAAFAELVRRHLDLVYGAALRRCRGNGHFAEDVCQRVFTTLAAHAAKLERHAVLAGWLYVTTRNVAANLLRAEHVRQRREAEAWTMKAVAGPEPAATVEWERIRPVLDQAMDELDRRDRDAVLLRYFEGRPFAEIAAALQMKEDAARMRVARALDKLRARLLRRGIASTSAALGAALATQGALAKPAGFAASVTTVALAEATSVSTAGSAGAVALQFMSMGKLSLATMLTVAALVASLGGNAYLLTRPTEPPPVLSTAAPPPGAPARDAAVAAAELNALVKTQDLVGLREQLRADGVSETTLRELMEGILRRRYREKLSQDRAARLARGWWKDGQRTWGTAESVQRLIDDAALLRAMVTEPLEQLLGPAPVEVAEADAKYSFLPPEMRQRLGRLDGAMPTGWSPTGDAATDEALRAEHENTRRTLEAERGTLLAGLTPEQRQSYDMRFSRTGTALAQQLEPLGATEREFMSVYPLAERYARDYDALPRQENSAARAGELDRRFAQQLIAELGHDRALDFIWGGTTEYASYARIARDAGLASTVAGRALQLAAETGESAAAIHADATLTLEQKRAALQTLQQSARSQLDALLPSAAQQRLTPASLEWLEALGNGRYKPIAAVLPGRGNLRIVSGSIALTTPPPTNRPPSLVPAQSPVGGH